MPIDPRNELRNTKRFSYIIISTTLVSGGSDTVFPSSGYENFQMSVKQNIDGTLLACHAIMLV